MTALSVTTDITYVTIAVTGSYNGIQFADSLTMPVKILPKGFPKQFNQGGSIGSQLFSNETPTNASFKFTIPSSIEPGS